VISAPKTVLVVDDEPAVRWLLQQDLPAHLPDFAVATVGNGQEAIDYLLAYPVDVIVTDIHMPVKDGFELLAHVRNHHPNLPVVVLASTAPRSITERLPRLGALRILQKPASPELVARHIVEARSETVRGRMTGVPLGALLQLMQLERKTCALLVSSGEKKGRLHFLSGELVNAYAFELDIEGEAAARHLLTLDKVTIDFERSLHNHVRRIHTPLETLLLEVATHQDEMSRGQPSAAVAEVAEVADLAEVAEAVAVTVADGSLRTSVDGLRAALAGLRARSDATAHLLEASAPELARGAAALARIGDGAPGGRPDEARLASAWGEVSELAARIVRAADALGGPSDHAR
jgi:CheY-like chemotaxis protein